MTVSGTSRDSNSDLILIWDIPYAYSRNTSKRLWIDFAQNYKSKVWIFICKLWRPQHLKFSRIAWQSSSLRLRRSEWDGSLNRFRIIRFLVEKQTLQIGDDVKLVFPSKSRTRIKYIWLPKKLTCTKHSSWSRLLRNLEDSCQSLTES